MHTTTTRFAWLRLNADGLLLALLALLSGLDLFAPQDQRISVKLGYIPTSLYAWTVLYLLSGLFMVYGFVRNNYGPELFGRFLLNSALLWETGRIAVAFGPASHLAVSRYLIFLALLGTTALRVSVLLSRSGVVLTVPARNSRRIAENGRDE